MTRLAGWWRGVPGPVRRAGVAVAGGAVIAAGLVMLVIPGPGLLTVAVGIAILASEFAWPRRLLRSAASRLPAGIRERAARRFGPKEPG